MLDRTNAVAECRQMPHEVDDQGRLAAILAADNMEASHLADDITGNRRFQGPVYASFRRSFRTWQVTHGATVIQAAHRGQRTERRR